MNTDAVKILKNINIGLHGIIFARSPRPIAPAKNSHTINLGVGSTKALAPRCKYLLISILEHQTILLNI
jgi:hypothetical protein